MEFINNFASYINNIIFTLIQVESFKEIYKNNLLSELMLKSGSILKNLSYSLPMNIFKGKLLENLFLIDSTICGFYFIKDFLLLKLSEKRVKNKKIIFEYKIDIIKRYNNIYRLHFIDRYLLYCLTFISYKLVLQLIKVLGGQEKDFEFLIFGFIIMAIPMMQNKFTSIFNNSLNIYLDNKNIFIKYSVSKLIVSSFQNLHNDIKIIDNFHIFLIYNVISFEYIYLCFKHYLLISLFYFLRGKDNLYYYYKAIKTAYLWNVGYSFQQISLYDAVYLANLIIKEKRWNELSKMEVINMFYVLIDSKFSNPNSSIYVSTSIILLKFISLWNIVTIFKIIILNLNVQSNFTLIIIVFTCIILFLISFTNHIGKQQSKIKKSIVIIISYYLIIFNVNDLLITLTLISNDIIYYILEELYFFTRNIHSIRKIVKINSKKQKDNIYEKEFVFINSHPT